MVTIFRIPVIVSLRFIGRRVGAGVTGTGVAAGDPEAGAPEAGADDGAVVDEFVLLVVLIAQSIERSIEHCVSLETPHT
jgi:hypothetical protein